MIVSSSSIPATASGSVRTYGNTATLRNNRRCDTRKTWHHLETRRIAMPANHPNSDDHQYLMAKSESGNAHDRIEANTELPTQGDAAVAGIDAIDYINQQLQDILKGPPSTEDYLAEFLAIQSNHPKNIGFFGTRNMGFMHQQLIEVLSYAMVLTENHIYTSGATGTNAAVIRGALRAERPDLLTVVLPQSRHCQPQESQEMLSQVQNVIEMPENDDLPLLEASRICNRNIISRVEQIICFAFHDSNLLLETCREAKTEKKIVTLFYLD